MSCDGGARIGTTASSSGSYSSGNNGEFGMGETMTLYYEFWGGRGGGEEESGGEFLYMNEF